MEKPSIRLLAIKLTRDAEEACMEPRVMGKLEKDPVSLSHNTLRQGVPTFWVAGTGSLEIVFSTDWGAHGFMCCLHPFDEALLVCTVWFLVCCGPVLVHGLGVGDPCPKVQEEKKNAGRLLHSLSQ